jgi:hypothetical protein
LSQPIDYETSWVDVNTTGSSIPTNLSVYNWRAYLLGANIDFAGGGNAAGISFGSGSGKRLGDVGDANPTGRISAGQNIDVGPSRLPRMSSDRPYYVAVVGAGADFAQNPNVNWQVSTLSTAGGTVRLQIAAGFKADGQWNEWWHGWDAGNEVQTALQPEGSGPLTRILTAGLPPDKDMFKIRICEPSQFRVTATPTRDAGGTSRVRLFILDAQGRGIAAINNTLAGTVTTLTVPPGTPVGDYFIAWSSYCAGANTPSNPPGSQNSAYTATGQIIWDFSQSSSWNVRLAPNGPGAAGTLAYWGDGDTCNGSEAYWLSLDMVGACYVSQGCDDIDFNNNGVFPEDQDVIDFFTVLSGGSCP